MLSLDVQGRTVPLVLKTHPWARRMSLRVDPRSGEAVITMPKGAREKEALHFAESHKGWIAGRLEDLPRQIVFADGGAVPLLGQDHIIRHRPDGARGVWKTEGEIFISGRAEHLPRRLTDWLKKEARAIIVPKARDYAAELGREVGRVTLRDPKSRWGSCSGRGDLSFSWRLILAPEQVLDYVVAHEVAHLVELNHSPRYWQVVERLVDNKAEARKWLKKNAARLHRYG